jgi:hypothetical protein
MAQEVLRGAGRVGTHQHPLSRYTVELIERGFEDIDVVGGGVVR